MPIVSIEQLDWIVQQHPAMSHTVFDTWAARKPGLATLGATLYQIGAFCDATRTCGSMAEGLTALGQDAAPQLLREIEESERGHENRFLEMARRLLIETEPEQARYLPLNDLSSTHELLRQLSVRRLNNVPGVHHKAGLLVQTVRSQLHFRQRADTRREMVAYNVGGMLAVEMLANRHIIPGEIRAIAYSDHYDVDLDQPDLAYLAEHAGENGAEAQHEKAIRKITADLLEHDNLAAFVGNGAQITCDIVGEFYDVLETVLRFG